VKRGETDAFAILFHDFTQSSRVVTFGS
jgi:hypothetical protein